MSKKTSASRVVLLWRATRPRFLTASIVPVLVGTAASLSVTGQVNWPLFAAAVVAIAAIHAGANVINDYYDHLSGNDWANPCPTPFSGGRRFIQMGLISPGTTLRLGLALLAGGGAIGMLIVAWTGSVFILCLGTAGILGGLLYTARPLQLGYRGVGELLIGLLFGLLPVLGSFYLQTHTIEPLVIGPALIVSCLIFMVILINEFPDQVPDQQTGKRTLVVLLGIPACIWLYRAAATATFAIAVGMVTTGQARWAGILYIATLPLLAMGSRHAGRYRPGGPPILAAHQVTVLVHMLGGILLTLGLVLDAYL